MNVSISNDQLPPLDTIKNMINAEVEKAGREAGKDHASDKAAMRATRAAAQLASDRAYSRIAQQISDGKLPSYLRDANGNPLKLPDNHEYMKQIRSFLADGVKTKTHRADKYNELTRQVIPGSRTVYLNLGWVDHLYVPDDAGLPVKQAPVDYGRHTTQNLEILKLAIAEFWENHNPEKPPKKDTVVKWLEEKKISNRVALVMDTIIRTEKAQLGGNKRVTPSKSSK